MPCSDRVKIDGPHTRYSGNHQPHANASARDYLVEKARSVQCVLVYIILGSGLPVFFLFLVNNETRIIIIVRNYKKGKDVMQERPDRDSVLLNVHSRTLTAIESPSDSLCSNHRGAAG